MQNRIKYKPRYSIRESERERKAHAIAIQKCKSYLTYILLLHVILSDHEYINSIGEAGESHVLQFYLDEYDNHLTALAQDMGMFL